MRPRHLRLFTVYGSASAGAKVAGPRVGIKEDATQLVGSTPMVSFSIAFPPEVYPS